ncbi:E4 SUMO-protein ligase PIAL1 isoform X2 [Ricinus communis]|uniref:E4 SUMO-protein ligase PIAL1 isoform X2 n=1 Tax=Ricinus communis TaxID=3988 RepID=UPI00201A2F1D|nr:E4 SUMO-protein ligase PIAL1 isoform X2 [Ricinus communis]
MMMGTLVPETAVSGAAVAAGQQKMSPSFANIFRIAAVADRLATHLRPGSSGNSNTEFFNLCLSLARGIDYAVANNEVPPKIQDLPSLLKQVCQRKHDLFLQAAIMVLMISVKIGNTFCSPGDFSTTTCDSLSVISTVFSRFYPLMKMGNILASLEVKPGYGAYVIDFHISKNTMHSPQDKIRLFVAQRDNLETSSCIISPQQVNFLLNGKGVERRTNVSMDPGPQVPTNVTGILKYGTNLLQAVGQFNGHYIIAVAFMSMTPLSGTPALLDYVDSSVAAADPDSDIIEGPSRVSLNCPISYRRIHIPVKGYLCKHLQCFDFSNFVNINSRRPSWRCPHCNQHVCYTNIRIDQNMVKVLKEVGDNVADVIISADGSWKAVLETDENTDHTQKEVVDCQKDIPEVQEPASVVDLTEDDDRMDVASTSHIEDRKPSQATLQSRPVTANLTTPSQLNIANAVDQNVVSQAEDSFWSDIYYNLVSGTSSTASALQLVNGMLGSIPANSLTSPVITDAVSPALNHDVGGSYNLPSSIPSQFSASDNRQLQQIQLMNAAANAAVNVEYGRLRQIPRHISRTPVAVQALPASPQTPVQQQRSRANMNTAIPSGPSLASQAALPMTPTGTGINVASNHANRHQHFSRSYINPHQGSSSLQHPSSAQNRNHLDLPFSSGQPIQLAASSATSNNFPGAPSASSGLRIESQNLHQHLAVRLPQSRSHSPSIGRSSSALPLPRSQTQQGVGSTPGAPNGQYPRFTAATQRQVQMTRQPPSVPVQIPTSRGTSYLNTDATRTSAIVQRGNVGELQVNSGTAAVVEKSSEHNWQPTGRMRGSLSSQAVSAYKDLIIQPTQPTQTPQPSSSSNPSPPNVPPQLEAFLSNSRNFYTPRKQNSAMSQSASIDGSSDTLP